MLKRLIILFTVLTLSGFSACACQVRPEHFGAVGDGVTDDAPAFNKCLSLGLPVVLTKGRTYLLDSWVGPITSDRFEIRGNGAKLVVGESYPLYGLDRILRFDNGVYHRDLFAISDLDVEYRQGCESAEQKQDAYFICIDNCNDVELKKVNFDSPGQKNKLAFLVSFGSGNLLMSDCNISVVSPGCEGGVLWFMNRFFSSSTVKLNRCRFVQDTIDETACFSALELVGIDSCEIDVHVSECEFVSDCENYSSGFLMAYNHFPSFADINCTFEKCSFVAKGKYPRRIMSFQLGNDPDFRYAHIESIFRDCDFDIESAIHSDEGLLSLPFLANRPWEDCQFSFNSCRFKIKGTHPVIGDRDGNKAGGYEFNDCTIDCDGYEPFRKQYNVPTSEIYISVNKRKKTRLQ